jgi:hypothetical protein
MLAGPNMSTRIDQKFGYHPSYRYGAVPVGTPDRGSECRT